MYNNFAAKKQLSRETKYVFSLVHRLVDKF